MQWRMGMKAFAMAALAALGSLAAAGPASAVVYTVDAQANSSSGGTGLASITLVAGQAFTVSSSLNDLWRAGDLPRFSDGRGIFETRFATAADDSGEAVGTLIEDNIFGQWTQNGLTANYGALVGEINGIYQALGANFSGNAWASGTLNLYYWDSNAADNSGTIAFDINAVPEPAAWALMIGGFGVVGGTLRRRSQPFAAA